MRLNQALQAGLEQIVAADVQLLWQCGKIYYDTLKAQVPAHPQVRLMAFIDDMAAAYAAADLIISRAGGSTISELIALSLPAILVPSPNVAEDHQTQNARSLANRQAALLIRDADAVQTLIPEALALIQDQPRLNHIRQQITAIEKHHAAREIVDQLVTVL
jgi:UDP-N-acetylglucosamine--N-acetylmuramyl-(pentapeptide) pyrophosphoryl-undecaprenol N-acetylglucosamine transferase